GIGWNTMEIEDVNNNSTTKRGIKKVQKLTDNRGAFSMAPPRKTLNVPKAEIRYTEFTSLRGYAKRRGGRGIFSRWKREYISLWRSCMLYFHRNEKDSDLFFNGKESSNKAKGEINIKEIVSVRKSSNKTLPKGRGIELESSSGKVWTISPEGDDREYNGWLNLLSNIVSKQNRDLYNRTKDNELQKPISDIKSSLLNENSKDAINTLISDVEAYNVDMIDVHDYDTEDDDGIGWNTMEIEDIDNLSNIDNNSTTKPGIKKIQK
ncbi:uncharacterized protein METZ01_LOCUS436015, partial [marine metagenome]